MKIKIVFLLFSLIGCRREHHEPVKLPSFFGNTFNVADYDSVNYKVIRITTYYGKKDTVTTETSQATFNNQRYIMMGISGVGSETYEDLQRDNEWLNKAYKYWKRKYEECNQNCKP